MNFDQKKLLIPFWIFIGAFIAFSLYVNVSPSPTYLFCALAIGAASFAPAYLWCAGKAFGIPVFPIFAATYTWTYGFPLLINHGKIINQPETNVVWATMYVILFLTISTAVWFRFVHKASPEPRSYYRLPPGSGDNVFLAMVAFGAFFAMATVGGWFHDTGALSMDIGWVGIMRAFTAGMSILGLFVLSYRAGSKELSKARFVLFCIFAAITMMAYGASLILLHAMMVFLLGMIGYTIGAKRFPWKVALAGFLIFNTLHLGKSDMRLKYHWNEGYYTVQPSQYLTLYGDWFRQATEIRTYKASSRSEMQETHTLLQRVSLMHMFLIAYDRSPQYVPYLQGRTYAIIPELLIPRILHPNKPRSHEGTFILGIHYGITSQLSTLHTTIGWGLLNEGYANFGPFGVVLLAVVLGLFYGKVTQHSINCHLLSARVLFAILVLRFSIQTEFTAGVYVTALAQPAVALLLFTFVFMKKDSIQRRYKPVERFVPSEDVVPEVQLKGSTV